MRWHAHHQTRGTGHLYQGRFKSFPIQSNEHLYTVLRYVERNAFRAKLVERAEDWCWSSTWRRKYGDADSRAILAEWPIERPHNWFWRVNQAMTQDEVDAIRHCVRRGTPFGGDRWKKNTAVRLGLEYTRRPRGRPKKQAKRKSSSQ